MALGIFTPSVLGMEAQSHALQVTSNNMSNLNTVGYKTNSTMFYTLLGSQPVVKGGNFGVNGSQADIGGVGYYDRTQIDKQGIVSASLGSYDVAINGTGNAFFQVKDSGGNSYYTRAGDFSTLTQNGTNYLVNSSGMKVQGYQPLPNGGFTTSPSDIIIKYPNKIPSTPTSQVEVTANVPATGVDTSSYGITVYGPNNDGATMNMVFTKVEGAVNTWDVTFNIDGGTVSTAEPIQALFDANGNLLSPKTFDVNVTWDDGSTNNIAMDISHMTQLAGGSGITNVSQDGKKSGDFLKSFIDDDGLVVASYSNGTTYTMGKIALAQFESPNNLTPVSGTLFEANAATGNLSYIKDSGNYLVPQALEQSTVNPETEFSKLVVIQRAYSLNTQAFTVGNEMLQTTVNLKS